MLVDKQLLQQSSTPEDTLSDFPQIGSQPTAFTPIPTNENDPTRPQQSSSLGAQLINQANKSASKLSPTNGPRVSYSELPTNGRFPTYSPFLSNEELAAQSQPWYFKAGNAITKGLGLATSTALQGTVGAVYGVGKWLEDGKFSSFYNNEFSQGLDKWNQQMENQFPNYYTHAEQSANWYSPTNFLSANFLFDKVIKNLGYAAGAYISGAGWAKAFTLLGSVSKLSAAGALVDASIASENAIASVANTNKIGALEGAFANIGNKFAANYNLLNTTQRAMYAGLMTTGEAGMEALQNANQFRQKLIDNYYNTNGQLPTGIDLDAINKQVDQVGNTTFLLNTALLSLTNYVQLPKIMGSSYNLEKREFVNAINNIEDISLKNEAGETLNTLGRTAKDQFYKSAKATTKFGRISSLGEYFFSPSEAFEEGAQNVISVGTENYWNKKNKEGSADVLNDLFGYGTKQTLTTKDGIEQILIGGLSGAISEIRGNFKSRKERAANTESAVQAFNSTYLGSFLKSANDSVNRHDNLEQQRVEAIKGGDILQSKDLETDELINYLTPRIQYGKYELFLNDIGQFKQIASTDEGLKQLQAQGLISQDATQTQVLSHLDRLQQFGNTIKAQYEALNIKYAGLKNKGGDRVYTDDVINKMIYASGKVDDYNRRIPQASQTVLAAGVLTQPIVEAVVNNTEDKDELIKQAVSHIESLPILQDAKDEIRQNLADIIEMSVRRKQFLDEYKDIRENPVNYQDKNELKDSEPVESIQIGDRELKIGRSYTPSNPIQIVNNQLELSPRTQILGRNYLDEISITTGNGVRSVPLSQVQSQDFIDQPLTRNQTELNNRLNKTIEDFFIKQPQQNPTLTDPTSTLEEKVQAVNDLPNNLNLLNDLQVELRKTLDQFLEEERLEQERLDKLADELSKTQDEISGESETDKPEDLPVPEDVTKEPRKPIEINFKSSRPASYYAPLKEENNQYHKREQEFLNRINLSSFPLDRDKLRIIPVTINNQDTIGLKHLIPETYEVNGKEINNNKNIDRAAIALVYAYETSDGLRLVDKEGNLLNKIGEENDPTSYVYTYLATTDFSYTGGENKDYTGKVNFSNPNKISDAQIKEIQKKAREDRKYLLSLKDAQPYSFTVSAGIPNIIRDESGSVRPLNNSVVDSQIIAQSDLSDKKLLSSRFPLSDTYLKLGESFYKLNSHKFTEQEATKVYELLRIMSKQIQDSFASTGAVSVDPTLRKYLSRIIYFDFPRGKAPRPQQVWFDKAGKLHLGTSLVVQPVQENIEANKQDIIDFFNGKQQNVNPYQVNNDGIFTEITSVNGDTYETVKWKSYQHYLLSPIYDLQGKSKVNGTTRNAILTTNTIVPQMVDGIQEAPLISKYVTIVGDISTQATPNTPAEPVDTTDQPEVSEEPVTPPLDESIPEELPAEEDVQVINEPEEKPVMYVSFIDTMNRMKPLGYTETQIVGMKLKDQEKILRENNLWYEIEGYDTELTSSEDTLNKVKEFLKRVGTTIEHVESIKINGTSLSAVGVADTVNNLIQVVDGKENVALTEEAMHIAVDLIATNNPELYNQLKSEAKKYKLYDDVVKSPEYQAAYDNPSNLQKEAVAKILTEYVIYKNESTEKPELIAEAQSWWKRALEFIKSIFSIANFNPFENVATKILKGTEDFSGSTIEDGGLYYKIPSSQESTKLFDKLKSVADSITKVIKENGKVSYIKKDSSPVSKTLQQRVDDYYKEKHANKEISDTQLKDSKKRLADDNAAHQDIYDILDRYIDSNTGWVRRNEGGEITPLDKTNISQLDPTNSEYYDTIEEYLKETIESYPEGTQFLFNQTVYDEQNDEAGTLDFVAIKPDGTHDDLNFKFLNVDTEKRFDVPYYDKRAYNLELSRLSKTLSDKYGLKKQGLSRAIPIVPKYTRGTDNDLTLQDMEIGDTTVERINKRYLLPVPSEVEPPVTKGVKTLIDKLNEILSELEKNNTESSTKYEVQKQINSITSAIRVLQVQGNVNPLIKTVSNQVDNIRKTIDRYNSIYQSGNTDSIAEINTEEVSKQLVDSYTDLTVYTTLGVAFKDVYSADTVEYKKLRNLSAKARNIQEDLVDISKLQVNSIANRYGVQGVLFEEKNVRWLAKNFMSLSDARTASTQTLNKIVNRARQDREFEFEGEIKKLKKLQDNLNKSNLTDKAQDLLFEKQDGKKTGLLTPKYKKEFYQNLNEALTTGNKAWVEENVDISKYNEEYEKSYTSFKEYLEQQYADYEGDEKEELISTPLEKFAKEYDFKNHPETALNDQNNRFLRFPKGDLWYSDQYSQLIQKGNEPILALYDYMKSKNDEAYETGLFKTYHATFFANVRKSFLENLTFGLTEDGTSAIRNQIENIFNFKLNPEDDVYGYIDPITHQPKDKIFAYYTSQISADEKSYDIFRVLTLWNHELIKYKYLSQVENQVKLLHLVESNKNHLETDKFGNIKAETIEEAIAAGNQNNAKYLKEFIDATIYGKRFSTDQPDMGLTVGVGKIAKAINKVLGAEILPMPDQQKTQVSVVKFVDAMNRWFRLKAMGVNPLSGISAWFGGTANAALNAGTYGSKNNYLAAQFRLAAGKFGGNEGKRYAANIQYFMPLVDNISGEKAREMSINKAQKYLTSGSLMVFLKTADKIVQYTNMVFFAENHTIVDGKIVGIQQYVKEQNIYDRVLDTSVPSQERKALQKDINTKIAERKRTKSLIQLVKVDGEDISFEGVERNSETVKDFRDKIQQFTREAIGNSTPENISQINRTIVGQSLMMFKSWIPPLVTTRFGGLRYVSGKDAYDYGRMRIMGTVIRDHGLKSISTLLSYYTSGTASQGQDNLIDTAKRIYQQKVEAFRKQGAFVTDVTGQLITDPSTGENLTAFETKMTEAEFVDMYLKGFDAAVKDMLVWLSMAGILISMRVYAPDKDEEDPQTKGYFRHGLRMLDKLQDEVGFFYNPLSWQDVIGGKIFPSIAVLTDIKNVIWNSTMNTFLWLNGDEDAGDKKVAKYLFKNIPGVNQAIYYMALFNSDLATELGIKIQSSSGGR